MKKLLRSTIFMAILLPNTVLANDFSTSARAEYVMECMKVNQGKEELLQKCSCEVDEIASKLKYDDFLEMSTALRYQSLGGDRGAEFRDPKGVKDNAKKYENIQKNAKDVCFPK